MTATARNGAAAHRRLAPAACLLLALVGLASPLAAQTADPILISNQNQTVRLNPFVGDTSFAQQFRTGSASGVYGISDVILTFSKAADSGTTTVTVRSDSSGNPADAALATMTLDSAGMGNIAFTPSSPVRLEPETRYWVVAQHSTGGTSGPRWAAVSIADGLDADSAAGWQIDEEYKEMRTSGWFGPGTSRALKIRLRGTVIPAVTVASDGDVTEGTAASFTLTRAGDTADALEVGVTVSETGDMVASGDEGTKKATFAAGSATATVTVPTQADSDSESDSTVTVAVADGDGYVAGTPSQAGVVVADDDVPAVTVTSSGNVTEGGVARFVLTRTGSIAAALTVQVTVSETGKMVAAGDKGTRTLRFSARARIFSLAVPTEADSTHEPDSTVTVTVEDGSDYDPGTPSQADVVVSDDDNAAPTGAPTIDDTTPLVGETLTADASGISDADGLTGATFTWQWIRVASGGTETRISGATAATYTVVAADEGATLKVEASFTDDDGTAETLESAETATVVPLPMLSIGDPSVNEGDTGFANLVFTVTLDPVSGNEVSVWYADFEDGTATRGTDYLNVSSAELTFAPGENEKRITVRVRGDRIDEEDETIEIGLGTPTGAEISRATGTGTIRDDDEATLAIDSPRAEEADAGATSTLTFTVTLDPVSDRRVTVAYADSASGTATSGTDYEAVAGGTLTFAPGESEKTVTVTVTGDDVGEGNETVGIALSDATGGATIGTASGTGTIVDNDVPQFSIDMPGVDEGDSGTADLTFTVTLDPASSGRTTVAYADSGGGTATSGTDYAAVAGGTLTFAPGDITKTVTVAVRGDRIDEPDETVEIALSGATGGADIATPAGTGTIADDDDEPTVTLVLTPNPVAEDGGVSTVTARLDHPSSEETTVTVSVAPDSPAVAGDYRLSTNRELTIPAGQTTSTGTVTVTSVNNMVDAPDKTVTVSATATNSRGVTGPANVSLTIEDNDATPTVTLVLSPDSITEAGGTSTVTARLNHPSSEATTVTVSAAPVSPEVAGDYTLSGSQLTIAAGATESTGVVTITAVDNDMEVPDRRVTVSGTAMNNHEVTDPRDVTLTIVDDESVDERQRRLEYTLASFGRTMAQDLVTALEDREWSASAGTTATLAGTRLAPDSFRPEEFIFGTLQRHVGPDGELAGTAALRELLSRSSFQLSLGDEGEGEAGGPRAGSLMLWGRGSQSWSRGRLDAAVATRGEMLSGQLGLEYRLREDMSLGVMLNASDGELDFDEALATEVEAELVSVHPYAQWSPGQGLRGWAMLGYGVGEATLADSFSALTETDIETDIEMVMAAAGGSHEVASRWGFDWSLGTNGFLVQFDADEREGLPAAVQSEVWQVRLLLEGSAGKELDGGSGLSGNVELAARVDGGDAETGLGMELGGGVAYGHLDLGIDVKASGRVLLSHEDGLEDAGMSLALEVDPGERGRGLYFALAPSWGNTTSGARAMWEGRQASTGVPHGSDGRLFDPTMWLDSELGYTAPLPTRRGALTSYGAFSSYGGAARQYRIGRRLEFADILSMGLEVERRESAGAAPEHSIWLKNSIRF